MAKKGPRILIGLVCSQCRRQNYITTKNKINQPQTLKIKKYCSFCQKKTEHQETKKLD